MFDFYHKKSFIKSIFDENPKRDNALMCFWSLWQLEHRKNNLFCGYQRLLFSLFSFPFCFFFDFYIPKFYNCKNVISFFQQLNYAVDFSVILAQNHKAISL